MRGQRQQAPQAMQDSFQRYEKDESKGKVRQDDEEEQKEEEQKEEEGRDGFSQEDADEHDANDEGKVIGNSTETNSSINVLVDEWLFFGVFIADGEGNSE